MTSALTNLIFVAVLAFCQTASVDKLSGINKDTPDCGLGSPGVPGTPGHNGLPGRDGMRGDKGLKGEKGERGLSGKMGPKGERGINGIGQIGRKGEKGENGNSYSVNWKQCAWQMADVKESGLIKECAFNKRDSTTALKVAYAANMRVYCSGSSCCGRWYITFNGTECSNPLPIDGVVYVDGRKSTGEDPHRHRQIEGFCENLPAGIVKVAVHVGNCAEYGSSDRDSGWNSVSRIMIEEYPQSQT